MDFDLMPGAMPYSALGEQRRREDYERRVGEAARLQPPPVQQQSVKPVAVSTDDRSHNPLRPRTFDGVIGQGRAKRLLQRMTQVAMSQDKPLSHVLLVGPSGTGKTTLAHVIAAEMGRQVFQLEAPVSHDTLLELREVMRDGDILFLDEIHQQAVSDRRGRNSSTQPEVLFSIMEDFTIPTGQGVLPFPHITFMGATTDEGALPDAFVNRFPIRPRMERYTADDMKVIAKANAEQLGLAVSAEAAELFAGACRGVPREMNNLIRNAFDLVGFTQVVRRELALEVICDLNGLTLDGLTADMQELLTFLYTRCKRTVKLTGEVTYQASVSTIATAIGKSRDVKAIQLRVEPYLIEQGYLQVGHGGRLLTTLGMIRAKQLLED